MDLNTEKFNVKLLKEKEDIEGFIIFGEDMENMGFEVCEGCDGEESKALKFYLGNYFFIIKEHLNLFSLNDSIFVFIRFFV